MRRFVAAAILSLALPLTACGTFSYLPAEYPLRDGLIAPMPVKGAVKIVNAQPSSAEVMVYSYGGSNLSSNLHAITEAMADQTSKELAKASHPNPGTAKTIDLKVTSLVSVYAIAFHWKSKLVFEARLGDGEVIAKTVPHASGDLRQDLNGCIAEAVMTLLKDDKVRAYLAE